MILKGACHVHTTFSFDGKVEIARLHDFFASNGFDFVLMSEHIEHLDLARMHQIYDACQSVSNEQCVLIPGIEIDELHILIFGMARPEAYDGLESFTRECQRRGAFIALSHPVKIRKGIPAVVLPMLEGVEIWNTRYDGRRSPRPASQALFEQLRQNSPGLVALGGMDFHSFADFSPVSLQVEARNREPGVIMEAIRGGKLRICKHGKVLPIYADSPALARVVHGLRGRITAPLYDGVVALYRRLKRMGLRVPGPIRRAVKKVL
jgi:hypothetical protein